MNIVLAKNKIYEYEIKTYGVYGQGVEGITTESLEDEIKEVTKLIELMNKKNVEKFNPKDCNYNNSCLTICIDDEEDEWWFCIKLLKKYLKILAIHLNNSTVKGYIEQQ